MQLAVAAQSLLVEIDVWYKTALVSVNAVCDFHLVDTTDFIKHHLSVGDGVFLKQLLRLSAVLAVGRTEHCSRLLADDLGQSFGIGRFADRAEDRIQTGRGCALLFLASKNELHRLWGVECRHLIFYKYFIYFTSKLLLKCKWIDIAFTTIKCRGVCQTSDYSEQEILIGSRLSKEATELMEEEKGFFLSEVHYEDFWGKVKLIGYTM